MLGHNNTKTEVVFKNKHMFISRFIGNARNEATVLYVFVKGNHKNIFKVARWYCNICKIVPDKKCFKEHMQEIIVEDPSGSNPYIGNAPVINGLQ